MVLKLPALVVIGTDCTGSCKSTYLTITTTMAPTYIGNDKLCYIVLDILSGIKAPTIFISTRTVLSK